jgi:hypothetical protein
VQPYEWAAAERAEAEAMALALALAGSSDRASAPPPRKPKDQKAPPVRFMLANAEALPFPDASFDCVVGLYTLISVACTSCIQLAVKAEFSLAIGFKRLVSTLEPIK